MMGDDMPNCELNRASKDGLHFGYPYCHEGSLRDPEFGKNADCNQYQQPVAKMGAHTAPLGLRYIQSAVFPDSHKNAFSLHATARGIEQKNRDTMFKW